MMRDMRVLILPERFGEVIDDRPQIRTCRQRTLERIEDRGAAGRVRGVPRLAEWSRQATVLRAIPVAQTLTLLAKGPPRVVIEPARRPRLVECFLDLEHLGQELRGRLGLDLRALARGATFLEPHEVFDAADGIPERAVGGVQPRGGVEGCRLLLGRRSMMEIRVMLSRQLVEPPLQLRAVDGQPSRPLEHLEGVHEPPHKTRNGPLWARSRLPARARRYAENEVPQPQLDFAFGFTNVKPPVRPCRT